MKKQHSSLKTFTIITVFACCFVCIIILQIFLIDQSASSMLTTSINGIAVNNNPNDINATLVNYYKSNAEDFELKLDYNNKQWVLTSADFEINSNIHTVLGEKQLREKNTNSKEKKISLIQMLLNKGENLEVSFNYIYTGLDKKIDNIISEIEKQPIDSTIIFTPNEEKMFTITPSGTGITVDKELLYEMINEQFLISNKINVSIPTKTIEPLVYEDELKTYTTKIAKFSTNVADSTGGRKANVKLALDKFNGLIIQPNEEISFNKITSPHTLENGYKIATIILNGRFQDGVGGGICQASTTLYNALLQTGIEILEVNKHTLPVRYVPLALDAMVSENISDLRFKNTTKYPLFIKTSSTDSDVTVEIYSHSLDGFEYKTKSETIKELPALDDIIKKDTNKEFQDKVLFEGEYYRLSYPRGGYEAKSYLQTYKDGILIEEKEIRHEIYKAQNGIIIEGAEPLPENFNSPEKFEETYSQGIIINNGNYTLPTNICP